ncbi:OmpP1/FadL family transporter [Faunimonas sp. B44]|uniref:OmpP1/FadL family transporter n=1 Tax=Faunimonas sp. B44 TaxID=3461493 RepID=UPI0040449C2A
MPSSKRIALLFGSAAVLALAVSDANAGAFALREQSAYGQGMSFAGMAAGGSLSSIFWNPATLSQVMGFEAEVVGSGVFPKVEITPSATTVGTLNALSGGLAATGATGDMGQDAFVPATYSAYRLTDSLIAGIAVNGPFGLVTNPATQWAGQSYSRTSKVFSLNVNPMIAYEINQMVSIGAGLQFQYFDTTLKTATGILPNDPTANLSGDDFGFGFNLGVQFRPFDGTEIGIGFRSSITQSLEGTLAIPGAAPLPITADLELPEMVSVGIRQRVTQAFTVAATAEWTNWSRVDSIAVRSPLLGGALVDLNAAQAGSQGLEFEYSDGWFFAIGGEYALNEATTLRAGIGYELSPINDRVRSTRLPDNDRLWLSAGLSHRFDDRFSFDLGYSFIKAADTDLNITTAANPHFNGLPFTGTADSTVHVIAAALKVKLGGARPPAADVYDEPLVRKY